MEKIKVVNCGGSGDCQQRVIHYLTRSNLTPFKIKKKQLEPLDNDENIIKLSLITKMYNEIDSYIPYIDVESLTKSYKDYSQNIQLSRGSEFWLLFTASKMWKIQFKIFFLYRGKYTRSIIIRWCSSKRPTRGIVYDMHRLHYLAAKPI